MATASAVGVTPPAIGETLTAAWAAFKPHAKILVGAFAIFFGANLVINLALMLLAGTLGPLLMTAFMFMAAVPSLLLLPGLYGMALNAVRGRKSEIRDLLLLFQGRFVHHVGLLLMQICGALACCVGVFVTQPLFLPGSFMVLDRKMDWNVAMDQCVRSVKPKLPQWILFHLVICLVGFAGILACVVGILVTGPLALCAWAYAYEKAFGGSAAKS